MEMSRMDSNMYQQQQKQQQQQEHKSQQIAYGLVQASSSMPPSFMSKDTGAYDLGELDQALLVYLDGQEQKQTLNIFPSQPMHVEPSTRVCEIERTGPGRDGASLASSSTSSSKKSSEKSMEFGDPGSDIPPLANTGKDVKAVVKREMSRKGTPSGSEQDGPKTPDPKTLRRLAQNREAARKSRLRKKAYVQQLESSRIKLNQLEHELQRARSQSGVFHGGGTVFGDRGLPAGIGGLSSEVAMFDMEYGRWLEEHHRMSCELRAAVQENMEESELRIFVNNCLAHHDELMILKAIAIKADVFHLVSGTWKTPAERCFLWMGDFRPSQLIKIALRHMEPLSEQQLLAIYALQQSTQETEEALTQGLEAFHQSLSDTVASDELSCPSNMATYMGHMVAAVSKLSTLESFVRQADSLRQQTQHRLHQILTTTQAARGFLAVAEYFHRLRALSSLWFARPRQE